MFLAFLFNKNISLLFKLILVLSTIHTFLNLHICFVKYSLEIARSKLFKKKIDSRVYFERDE